MELFETLATGLLENWHIWLVSVILIVAAVIDGVCLRVPNWITFPMILGGWVFCAVAAALDADPASTWYTGLGWSLAGTFLGLALLFPLYMIGGMGAGDVKLLAGVGAWVLCADTFYAFCLSVIIGAVIAVGMVVYRRAWKKHTMQLKMIVGEIMTVGSPDKLFERAAARKSSMLLLPYGIPIAIGTILYFAYAGKLV